MRALFLLTAVFLINSETPGDLSSSRVGGSELWDFCTPDSEDFSRRQGCALKVVDLLQARMRGARVLPLEDAPQVRTSY